MKSSFFKLVLVTSMIFAHAGSPAEDIDIFIGAAPPDASDLPNVLIIVDNTANWGSGSNPQPFTNEKAALVNTFNALPVGSSGEAQFRVGIMFAGETGSPNNNIDGGYVRAAIRPMTSANKSIYSAFLNNIDSNADKGNGGKSSLVMAEAYRYLTGGLPVAGNYKVKTDYTGNTYSGTSAESRAVYALPGNALPAFDGSPYSAPPAAGCNKTYIIYLSNGPANDNTTVTNGSKAMLEAAGGNTTTIPLTPNGSQGNVIDEWARFMNTSQGIVSYTIDVNPGTTGQGPGWTALLRSAANVGRGKYFAVNSATGGGQAIVDAMNIIFSEIQSVNSAFASASLPVSVNTQGTYLNQVFIGMFRPQKEPRWFGNLKQYKFRATADAEGNVVDFGLADKNNVPAIFADSGFITPCATSFWSTADTYWPAGYQGSCIGANVRSNAPDGEIVEKGGAAQRLRALSSRNAKTCTSCGNDSALQDFSTTTASIDGLGVADATEQATLVDWMRGLNVDNEMAKGTTTMRPSAHGDVLHSRPLAVDYGGTTGVVVFYGGNDGMLRAINGNQADMDGNELWSFAAPEHFGKFKRLRSNNPGIKYPNAPAGTTPKDYFFDGSIGLYRSGSTVWIYPTMRRGGRMVYAFDVTVPASPSLKWKRGCPNLESDSGCSEGFTGIGQTWSVPQVMKAKAAPSTPLIVMGGGYDACEDADAAPNNSCTLPKGNQIFVLNAASGEVLKTLDTDRSVPADVVVVDGDDDGYVDVAYAVDTGANIYRITIGDSEPSAWTIKKIASLGCSTEARCDRKFLFAPAVVVRKDFNAVLVGSGNRERPLLSNQAANVENGFFMIKDYRKSDTTPILVDDLVALDPEIPITDTQIEAIVSPENLGWYLAFGSGGHIKEQVVTSAVVAGGLAFFSTSSPKPASECGANLGTARGYVVNFLTGGGPDVGPRYSQFAGGGLPPSPVTGVVDVTLSDWEGGTLTKSDGSPMTAKVPFVIGAGSVGSFSGLSSLGQGQAQEGSPIQGQDMNTPLDNFRRRVFWFINTEQAE